MVVKTKEKSKVAKVRGASQRPRKRMEAGASEKARNAHADGAAPGFELRGCNGIMISRFPDSPADK